MIRLVLNADEKPAEAERDRRSRRGAGAPLQPRDLQELAVGVALDDAADLAARLLAAEVDGHAVVALHQLDPPRVRRIARQRRRPRGPQRRLALAPIERVLLAQG